MISAKRFQCLDGETDAAVADMLTSGNAALNSSVNELKGISATTQDFIDQATQNAPNVDSLIAEAKKAIDPINGFLEDAKNKAGNLYNQATSLTDGSSMLRETKSLYGNIKDIAQNGTKSIESQLKNLLPNNPSVQSAFSSLSSSCKNRASSYPGFGKPYDVSMNCNGRNRPSSGGACDTGAFSDVLSKLTGGNYNSSYRDLNKTLSGLMSLSNFGYSMNMCGVFGALSSTMGAGNQGLLSRASAGLLGDLSAKKNTLGMFDLAGSSANLYPMCEMPGAANTLFDGFSLPDEIKEFDYPSIKDRMYGAAEIFGGSTWLNSPVSSFKTLAATGSFNPDLGEIFASSMMDDIPDLNNLDAVIDSDELGIAYLAKDGLPEVQTANFDVTGFSMFEELRNA